MLQLTVITIIGATNNNARIIGAYFQTPQIRIRLSAVLDCYRARTYNTGVQLVGYQSIKTNLYNEQSIINAC